MTNVCSGNIIFNLAIDCQKREWGDMGGWKNENWKFKPDDYNSAKNTIYHPIWLT